MDHILAKGQVQVGTEAGGGTCSLLPRPQPGSLLLLI